MPPRLFRIAVLVLIWLPIIILSGVSNASSENNHPSQSDNNVYIGIYVISIGNFEFTRGTYVVDFYLIFTWHNQSLTPVNFEFMNGRALSKEKIFESNDNGTSEVWYRIQANLFITPQLTDYPFDTQQLKIVIEDAKYNSSSLTYIPRDDFNGVDDHFTLAGWKMQSYSTVTSEHIYPWAERYSQTIFTIKLQRNTGLSALKLLLPPLIFCIVSGLSFFFKADKITHRLGLGTSMLISAVMFHLSQISSLPALPSLILIDKIMISVYAFLASSLLATTLIYIDDEYWKQMDYTKNVNRYGAVLTIVLPFVVFAFLRYLF